LTYGLTVEPADSAEGRYCDRLPSSMNQTLLIVVCSAVENVDRRNAIRSVTLTYFLGSIASMRCGLLLPISG